LTLSFASNDELVFSNAGFNLGVDNGKSKGSFGFDHLQPPHPIDASLLSPNTNGTFATTGNRFAYNQSTGQLFYDAQGSTAGSTVHQVATLTNHPTLTAANLFFTN
jgi:Ca2+-binding RTX toxin-like protein